MWCLWATSRKWSMRLRKPCGILLPEAVVEEDADAGEAQILGPAELPIDGFEVEGVRLPHLELVDGGAWDVVAAAQPAPLLMPGAGLFGGPLISGEGGRGGGNQGGQAGHQETGSYRHGRGLEIGDSGHRGASWRLHGNTHPGCRVQGQVLSVTETSRTGQRISFWWVQHKFNIVDAAY